MIRKIGKTLMPAGVIAIVVAIVASDHAVLRAIGTFMALAILEFMRTKRP
jgi:hypothetical protein